MTIQDDSHGGNNDVGVGSDDTADEYPFVLIDDLLRLLRRGDPLAAEEVVSNGFLAGRSSLLQ